jgi:hypothetical protein
MCEREPSPPPHYEHREDLQSERAFRSALRHPLRQAWRAFQYVDGAYLRGHPELGLFPTPQQRRRAVGRAVSKFLWRRAFWWVVAKSGVFAVLLGLLTFALIAAVRTLYPFPLRAMLPWAVIPMALVIIVAVVFANRWLRRSMPGLLRHELLDCGVPICIACGYPLFDLRGPSCPECGTPFEERARQILALDDTPSRMEAADGNVDQDNSGP